MNLVSLQLNIRSLISHQYELCTMFGQMKNRNSTVHIILLCETFLSDDTEKLVRISGYDLITSNRKDTKGGGTATLLIRSGITYKRRKDLEIFQEKILESTCVEIQTKCNKGIVVGSIYKPPNTNETMLNQSHLQSHTQD